MTTLYGYDVIVIGAGIGGMVAAVTATGLGKRVVVVEKGRVGGNCTNTTCVPSKALIRLGHVNREIGRLHSLGVLHEPPHALNGAQIMSHLRSIVQKAYAKDIPETFERIGINIVPGTASFLDPFHVQAGDRILTAPKFIIAAGTSPLIPPIPGLDRTPYLTNESLYDLTDLPKSIAILGGGVDGLEYASAFGRLGVETTVIEMAQNLLPQADRELAQELTRILAQDGIRLQMGAKAVHVDHANGRISVAAEQQDGAQATVHAERLLVTIGRKPDLSGLGLENAGVEYSNRGIVANDKLRTTANHIYACGDVVGPYQLASTAEYQGVLAATNAILPIERKVDYRNNVYVIFTEPPLAWCGLTEQQAYEKLGHKAKVYRFSYEGMRRAMIDGAEDGMAKFICDGRGRIAGAHILGESAGEVIHEVQVIRAMKRPLHAFHEVVHAYPTYAQALVGRAGQLAFLDKMGTSRLVEAALHVMPGLANKLHVARNRLAEVEPDAAAGASAQLEILITSTTGSGQEIRLQTTQLTGRVYEIKLPSDLTEYDEEPFVCACSGNGAQAPACLVLDFSHVQRMNGLGAGMLVKLAARARQKGQVLKAFGLSSDLRRVFKLTALDQAAELYDSQAAAQFAAGVAPPSEDQGPQPAAPFDKASCWAPPIVTLDVPPISPEARNLNVQGRRIKGPVHGFGQLWQKIYRLDISRGRVTPEEAMAILRRDFPDFQPRYNRFYPSASGIRPGSLVLIDASTPGGPVSTAVVVLYADDLSFMFGTPEGHPEAGWITFSAHERHGRTVVQILGLARANDPLYESAFRAIGARVQVRIWTHVLSSFAARLGVPASVSVETACIDPHVQWSEAANLWYNAQVRTLLYEPARWFRKQRG